MKRLLVKICGMTDTANIAEVATLSPDYMGLIFVQSSPRYVGDRFDPADLSSLPSTTKRVGVFKDSLPETIIETTRRFALDAVQLHGSEDDSYLTTLKASLPGTTILKAVSVSSAESLASLSSRATQPDAYLLDSGSGGTGVAFDWRWLRSYTLDVPFLLAGGIGLHNVDEIIEMSEEHPRLIGIDINSRAERAVGIKDRETLQEILKRLGR